VEGLIAQVLVGILVQRLPIYFICRNCFPLLWWKQ